MDADRLADIAERALEVAESRHEHIKHALGLAETANVLCALVIGIARATAQQATDGTLTAEDLATVRRALGAAATKSDGIANVIAGLNAATADVDALRAEHRED